VLAAYSPKAASSKITEFHDVMLVIYGAILPAQQLGNF
jgi:hypothetical protein